MKGEERDHVYPQLVPLEDMRWRENTRLTSAPRVWVRVQLSRNLTMQQHSFVSMVSNTCTNNTHTCMQVSAWTHAHTHTHTENGGHLLKMLPSVIINAIQ